MAILLHLFVLLSYLCYYIPESPIDVSDLYEAYTTTLRSLPLSIFTAFITVTTSTLRTDSQISILSQLLELLMPSAAVKPAKVDKERYRDNGTSPAILERCFLPNAANTIAADDNAKLSLLLEELMQIIWVDGTEKFSEGLLATVRRGVEAREAKISAKKRGRPRIVPLEDTDVDAKAVLRESGRRLVMMAELIQAEVDGEEGLADTNEDDEMQQDGHGKPIHSRG
jgi:hypothetical protein